MISLRITPLPAYPRSVADAAALEEQYANYLATLSGPWRCLSWTRRWSFQSLRHTFNRRAAQFHQAGEAERWRWRWTKHYRRMYDTLEQVEPLLTIEHYLLYQPATPLSPAVLANTIQEQFLLPAVTPAPLPPLIVGRYREHASWLEPLDGPGQPYLRVLTTWDVRGEWHFGSWRSLLMGDWELAVCIDATTLSQETADRRGTDVYGALAGTLGGPHATFDQRSERALAAVQTAMHALDRQSLHEVAYAVLLRAPSLDHLDAQTHRLRAALGSRLKLDVVPGGQGAYARLFTPVPASQIAAPLIRRNTLSHGLACKLPWLVRKTARETGVCFGYDRVEGLPILYDVFGSTEHDNAHLLAIGQPNAGKTIALSALALRHATAGAQVIYLDPIGKCRLLCDAVGEQAAYVEVDTGGSLNILDRASADLGTQRAAIERRLSIVLGRPDYGGGRAGVRPRELTNFEVGALDGCLAELYGDAAHTPILGDLVRALRGLADRPGLEERVVTAGAELAAEIAAVLLGSRGALLNAPTTIRWDFHAPVTGYSFANIVTADQALLPLIYDLAWEALDRYVRTRPATAPPLIIIIDELAYMSVVPELQTHVALSCKTYRNFRAFLWTADQDAATYFGADGRGSRDEQRIAGNSFIKLLFRQEGQGAAILAHAYEQLADEHVQAIRTAPQGHLIALFGDEVHPLVMQLTDGEVQAFCTPARRVDQIVMSSQKGGYDGA